MVERWKPLHASRSYKNEEKLGEKMVATGIPLKMISRDSQKEGEGICVLKAPLSTKEEGHARGKREWLEERREELVFLKLQLMVGRVKK